MLFVLLLLMALIAPPETTIQTTLEPLSSTGTSDLVFIVQSDAPRAFFAQVSASECLGIGPQLFYFDLKPGEMVARTVRVAALPCAHATGETVTIQVWALDGDGTPAAAQVVFVPIVDPFDHLYLPQITVPSTDQ